jgi:uncharacterized protein (DUF3084 family)
VDITDMEGSMPDNFTSSLERISHAVNDQFAGRRDAPATGQDLYNMSVLIDANFSKLEASINSLHARFDQVDARFAIIDSRFKQIDARFERIDARFEQIDARFNQMDRRFDQIDQRFVQVDSRFDTFKTEIENMFNRKMLHFLYMQVGISVALFSAMFTALYFSLGALVSAR